MRIKLNEKGKGSYEFLTVVVVCLGLSAIVLAIAIRNSEDEKFQVFRYNAKTVGINAINYNNVTVEDTIYLYEMIDKNLVTNIKNNFTGDEFCDPYASKVEFVNDNKLVTLKCGNYLIYQQEITDKEYSIYRVSNWTFDKLEGNNVDTNKVYALILGDKNVFGSYYEEDLFLKLVSSKYGKKYDSLKNIKKDFTVKSKTVYRKRKLVD